MRPFYGIVVREFQRLLRQRERLLSSFVRPLLWLFVVGSGFGALAATADPGAYRRFMLPGVLGLVLLFSAFFAALSTAHDREAGVIRLLLIAPIRRSTVVLGKVASSALVALAQACVLLLLLPVLQLSPDLGRLAFLVAGMALTALTLSALGMLLASRAESLENFAGIMNFVIFPMFFLSGALYPTEALPSAARLLVLVNPLTYGVDLMKHALLNGSAPAGFGAELPVATDLAALAVTLVLSLALTSALFDREARLTRRVAGTRAAG